MTRHWNAETHREADQFYPTLSEAEIRRRQDLTRQQIEIAHRERLDDALADLHEQEDALTRDMLRRLEARQ